MTLPLSFAQQRLWFLDRVDNSAASLRHITVGLRMRGHLDSHALRAALDRIVARHEVLRTTFSSVDGEPVQIIGSADSGFALIELEVESDSVAEQISREETLEPFELSRGPLLRGRLLRLPGQEHVLLVTQHDIIADKSSIRVFMREMSELYSAFIQGRTDPLRALPLQYADYVGREHLEEGLMQDQLEFWKQQLSGAPELLHIATDRPRSTVQSRAADQVHLTLSTELAQRLRELAQQQETTLFVTLLTGWAVLLGRCSGQEEVVIGTPVANRQQWGVETLIGPFANTLALRIHLQKDLTVEQLLRQVKSSTTEAYAHQDLPFERVVEALNPTRGVGHSPVFQVLMECNSSAAQGLQIPGLTLSELPIASANMQFDLSLSLNEADDIAGTLQYARDLFERVSMNRLVDRWRVVLEAMVTNVQCQIDQLPLLTTAERDQVLRGFNDTDVAYSHDRLIHELIEEQVLRTPDAVAVVYDGQSLCYTELNQKANQLARFLRVRGIGSDQLVGICVERSLEMVVGLLGILKAGGAYVPLDPGYPLERLQYMLSDASPRVLLTQERLCRSLPQTGAEVIALDGRWSEIALQPTENLQADELDSRSNHLAYVIYTSGSTGKPKGAMNEHRGVVNRLQWMQDEYRLGCDDRVLQKTPFSFDVSVWEFFWTLMSGARLIMARPDGHKDPTYLCELIEATGVTTLHFVPSMLQSFLEQHRPGACSSVRHIVCSGEELSAALQRKCFGCFPQAQLSNLYGPTEAAVDVTSWECSPDDTRSQVPIGRPIANIQIYLLDPHQQPVPIEVAGEIYIGGIGVGRGYLNRPELSAQKFIQNPFTGDPQARLYKTGDLGRWRADGSVEYLGRNDHQVKIRGFRIELGEIEAQLLQHPRVKEVVVLAREDEAAQKRLVAYVVCAEDPASSHVLTVEALRTHLKPVLPDYMMPSAFVILEKMPVTANGKLDRRALPTPALEAYGRREYEPPQGEIEETLARIWQELLRVERVGRHDPFFDLGGHSLLGMKLILQVAERFTVRLPVLVLLQHPTVRDMAQLICDRLSLQSLQPDPLQPQTEFEEGVI